MYRQGRGALQDFATQKPALMRLNSQKFSKYGQWGTGVGLSGAAGYYYKKMMGK